MTSYNEKDNYNYVSVSDEKYLNTALTLAQQSPVLMRHGCVAVLSGKIVGRGFNNYRTYSSDYFIRDSCTCHAEIAALRNTYNNLSNTYGKFMKNIKVV